MPDFILPAVLAVGVFPWLYARRTKDRWMWVGAVAGLYFLFKLWILGDRFAGAELWLRAAAITLGVLIVAGLKVWLTGKMGR